MLLIQEIYGNESKLNKIGERDAYQIQYKKAKTVGFKSFRRVLQSFGKTTARSKAST